MHHNYCGLGCYHTYSLAVNLLTPRVQNYKLFRSCSFRFRSSMCNGKFGNLLELIILKKDIYCFPGIILRLCFCNQPFLVHLSHFLSSICCPPEWLWYPSKASVNVLHSAVGHSVCRLRDDNRCWYKQRVFHKESCIAAASHYGLCTFWTIVDEKIVRLCLKTLRPDFSLKLKHF